MTSTTPLEAKALRNIVLNNYNDHGDPVLGDDSTYPVVWSYAVAEDGPETIPVASIAGVMSSLAKKGLVWTSNEGREAIVGLTDEGVAAYLSLAEPPVPLSLTATERLVLRSALIEKIKTCEDSGTLVVLTALLNRLKLVDYI